MRTNLVILCYLLSILTPVMGSEKQAPLFDYRLILNAQKKCDDSAMKSLKYPPNRKPVFALAKKSRVVISDLSIKETANQPILDRGQAKHYEVKFNLYAQIACNKEEILIDNGKGVPSVELPVITQAWKHPELVDIVGDEKGEDIFKPGLTVDFTANDLPPEPGVNGLACISEKSDFLKVDAKAFAITLCGKDTSQAALQKTIDSIKRVQKAIASAK